MTTKNRARIAILSHMFFFPSIADKNWTSCYLDKKPQVGDLVAMNCAPASKWYLAWLHEINPNNGWPKYLLESIEDGEMCWWDNIGLSYYSREGIASRPEWRWNDDQYAFNDRWLKVAKKNDAYIVLPCQAKFLDDGAVVLDVRIRFSLDDYRNPVSFPNWREVTTNEMEKYFKKSVEEYEAKFLLRSGDATQ